MRRIYISAPITGREETADERFGKAVEIVRRQGDIAINPWQENKSFRRWGDAMCAGLRLLNRCDGILLCRGWQNSTGCLIEQKFAQGAGLEVLFEESLEEGES